MIVKYGKVSCLLFILIALVCYPYNAFAAHRLLSISSSNGLKYTKNDAKLIASAFGRYVGFDRSNITILTKKKSHKDNIKKQLRELAETVKNDDLVVIFFAGHGVIIGGEYFFVPQLDSDIFASIPRFDPHQARKYLLSGSEIREAVSRIPTEKKLLILDTCQSGGITTAFNTTAGVVSSNEYSARGIVSSVDNRSIGIKVYDKGSKPAVGSEANFTIIAASKADQIASESDKFGNGILTHYLVKILKKTSYSRGGFFDSRALTTEVISMSRKGGWEQKAVVSGGQYFSTPLRKDVVFALPSY